MSSDSRVAREPLTRRKNVLGFRTACERTWGTGAYEQTLALLPNDVREATAGLLPMEEWVPEAFVVAWVGAVWRGPAKQDEATIRRYVASTVAHGFGHVRRLFLRVLTPDIFAKRGPDLWREEHSTGVLEAKLVGERLVRLRLSDHPYIETPLMRIAVAEALRFTTSLTRAKNVTEKHAPRGTPLLIDIAWERKA